MKQEGIKRVRAGQVSPCYKSKRELIANYKAKLKQLESDLELAKTKPESPMGFGVSFVEQRIKTVKNYLSLLTK